jgi:trans-2,3-dihydro-3-hydroxyanthranilate isomerase
MSVKRMDLSLSKESHFRRRFNFVHIDVFAGKPLEGNQLAIFPDAEGLTQDEMQAIAREMHLSETTFVFRREASLEKTKGIRTRIFTVEEELPFAGHPTLGTAWILKKEIKNQDTVVLDLNIGSVPVRFSIRDGNLYGEMTQPEPKWGMTHNLDRVASALGVDSSELDPQTPIETISTGVPFIIVPFRSLDSLQRLRPNPAKMDEYTSKADAKFFYLVSRETKNHKARLHSRMIFYGGEDPATGSAAGPAAAWMLRHRWIEPEEQVWIEQGLGISRPSQIFVRAEGTPENPTKIRVGGFCFEVMKGELSLKNVH